MPDSKQFHRAPESQQTPKDYLDYPYERRVELLKSIREKRESGDIFSKEEYEFLEADRKHFGPDDVPYKGTS